MSNHYGKVPMPPVTYQSEVKVMSASKDVPQSSYVLPSMASTYSIINLNSTGNTAHSSMDMNITTPLREDYCVSQCSQGNVSVPSSVLLPPQPHSHVQQQHHSIPYSIPSYAPPHIATHPPQMTLPPMSAIIQPASNHNLIPARMPTLAQLLSEDMQLVIDDIIRKFTSTSSSVRSQVLDQMLGCLTDTELDKFALSLSQKAKLLDRNTWTNAYPGTHQDVQQAQWIDRGNCQPNKTVFSFQRLPESTAIAAKGADIGYCPASKVFADAGTQTDSPTETKESHCKNCVCTGKESSKWQYVCEHCSKRFTRWRLLKLHMRKHEQKTLFKCSQCKQNFDNRQQLLAHRKTHPIHRPFICNLCLKGFTTKSGLKTHQLLHAGVRQFKCSYCQRAFMHKPNLLSHEKIHTGDLAYSCSICDKKFVRLDHLNEHQKVTHSDAKPHTCSYCDKQFKWKNALTQHEARHTNPKSYPCSECGKVFPHTSNLRMHMRIHSGNKPHICKYCSKAFIQKSDLTRHETTHTGIKPLQCLHCPRTFMRKRELNFHEKTHLTSL